MPFVWRLAISATVAILALVLSVIVSSDSENWLWSLPWLHRILPPLDSGPNPLAGLVASVINAITAGLLMFVMTFVWRRGDA